MGAVWEHRLRLCSSALFLGFNNVPATAHQRAGLVTQICSGLRIWLAVFDELITSLENCLMPEK